VCEEREKKKKRKRGRREMDSSLSGVWFVRVRLYVENTTLISSREEPAQDTHAHSNTHKHALTHACVRAHTQSHTQTHKHILHPQEFRVVCKLQPYTGTSPPVTLCLMTLMTLVTLIILINLATKHSARLPSSLNH